jgi:hypothetical protein
MKPLSSPPVIQSEESVSVREERRIPLNNVTLKLVTQTVRSN